MREIREQGHVVHVLTKYDDYIDKISPYFDQTHNLRINLKGKNLLQEIITFCNILWVTLKIKPDYLLTYTIKPNLYGGILSLFTNVKIIQNVTGFGSLHSQKGVIECISKKLYRFSTFFSHRVFFQNREDCNFFISENKRKPINYSLIPGSGVDLSKFRPNFKSPNFDSNKTNYKYLFFGRLLWDKGVGEFFEAAKYFRRNGIAADFLILGFIDVDNPSALKKEDLLVVVDQGFVTYLGCSDDVRKHLAGVDCVVFPSYYREGVPKSLLESAAMGLPIITTDSVGCREVVEDGVNGFLCSPKSTRSLIEKILAFQKLPAGEKVFMGRKSRERAVNLFDERIVIKKYLASIK